MKLRRTENERLFLLFDEEEYRCAEINWRLFPCVKAGSDMEVSSPRFNSYFDLVKIEVKSCSVLRGLCLNLRDKETVRLVFMNIAEKVGLPFTYASMLLSALVDVVKGNNATEPTFFSNRQGRPVCWCRLNLDHCCFYFGFDIEGVCKALFNCEDSRTRKVDYNFYFYKPDRYLCYINYLHWLSDMLEKKGMKNVLNKINCLGVYGCYRSYEEMDMRMAKSLTNYLIIRTKWEQKTRKAVYQ